MKRPSRDLEEAQRLHQSGRLNEALALFQKILSTRPDTPEALHGIGVILFQSGHPDQALPFLERTRALLPGHYLPRFHLGLCLLQAHRPREALEALESAFSLAPGQHELLLHIASAREILGDADGAEKALRQLLARQPRSAEALNNLGNLLKAHNRLDDAAVLLRQALALLPESPEILVNLANVDLARGDPATAAARIQQALTLRPHLPEAWNNLGDAQLALGNPTAAADCFRRATAQNPDFATAWSNLGHTLSLLADAEGAMAALHRAITLRPHYPEAWHRLGRLLRLAMRYPEAETALRQALALRPGYPEALDLLLGVLQEQCDWQELPTVSRQLLEHVRNNPQAAIPPFSLFSIPSTPEEQKLCARKYSAHHFPGAASWRADGFPRHQGRLRIGYLSADFHEHATSYLLAEVIERHDRDRFHLTAFSYGPNDGSPMRRRLENAFDRFEEIAALSDPDAVRLIREREIDILVDLKGYTQHARPGIAALRPAPLLVNWLGFPGTMGADFMDYLIVDPFLVPVGAERHYTEKIVRLPHTYQPNDRQRPLDPPPTREHAGLPETGRVLCAFNQLYKVTPEVFSLWLSLLKEIPDTVLWLLSRHDQAGERLRRLAREAGVDPGRLLFAAPVPLRQHLARTQLADLLLDTTPCCGHTTVSDALWAGVPVVTCPGETFVSRVAGSLLHAVGLPELVVASLSEYRELTLDLLRNPQRLEGVRRKLWRNRPLTPLFDTPRFTRHLERAYARMWRDWSEGKAPESFDVDDGT